MKIKKIWIYTPNITSQSVSPNKRNPVLYLLDGDAHFFFVAMSRPLPDIVCNLVFLKTKMHHPIWEPCCEAKAVLRLQAEGIIMPHPT